MPACRLLKQKLVVKDVTLPVGSEVWIPIMAVHRSEANWGPEVHSFKPERWLTGGQQVEEDGSNEAAGAGKVRRHLLLPLYVLHILTPAIL
jgi:cytochrome P450